MRSSSHTRSVDSGLGSMARSPKLSKPRNIRHSSFIPGQDDHWKLGHTINGRSVSGPLEKWRSDMSVLKESTPSTLKYSYPRNGIKMLESDYASEDPIAEEPDSKLVCVYCSISWALYK